MATDALGRNLITDPDQIQSGRYAIVNVELTTQDVTVVPQMNGRQGEDNMRPVYFWAKDGDESLDITNLRITIKGKDAKGVIKTACTVTDVISETGGKFKMDIPGIFYQAPGAYEECWMEFATPDGQVVSTVNLYMVVIENNLIVTAGADKMYIDSIQKVIDEAMSRIKPLQDELDALQALEDAKDAEIKALEDEIAALQKQIKDALLATLNGNNDFTGVNTFDNDVFCNKNLTVKGSLTAPDIITPDGDLNTLLKCYHDSAFNYTGLDSSPLAWHPDGATSVYFPFQVVLVPNFASDGKHGLLFINGGVFYNNTVGQASNYKYYLGTIDGLPSTAGWTTMFPNYVWADLTNGDHVFAHLLLEDGGKLYIQTNQQAIPANVSIEIANIFLY